MAEIRTYPLVRHLRAEPTSHILHFKRGKLRRSGAGLSFFFSPLGASIAEIPLDDRDLAFQIQGRSADFQDVYVSGVVTWRVTDPERLARRIDFSIDATTGRFRAEPIDKLSATLIQLAEGRVVASLQRQALAQLLDAGIDAVRAELAGALEADGTIPALGLEVVATRVASLRPSAELEKALRMPARERIQQAADEATYARRAQAVEKERIIQENELATKIELAKKEEVLIAQHGQNQKKRVTDETEAEAIAALARSRNARLAAESEAEAIRLREGAEVEAERARVAIYDKLGPDVMMGLAAHALATKLHSIEHLSISPDMLGTLVQRALGAHVDRLGS